MGTPDGATVHVGVSGGYGGAGMLDVARGGHRHAGRDRVVLVLWMKQSVSSNIVV